MQPTMTQFCPIDFDSDRYQLKRLQKMKAQKRPPDPIKLANFWMRLRSKLTRKETLRGLQRWFGGASLAEIVQNTLKPFIEKQRHALDSPLIDWQSDVAELQVQYRASTPLAASVA